MGSSKKPTPYISIFLQAVSVLSLGSLALLLIPISPAFSAGIASTSVALYLLVIFLISPVLIAKRTDRLTLTLAMSALVAAGVGLMVPQISYINTASKHDVDLRLNIAEYLHFSGYTTQPINAVHRYDSSGGEKLDILEYKSDAQKPLPAVALLHGGGWRYGNHYETGLWPEQLSKAGFRVFSIEYRLANDSYHTWRDAPSDVHNAITYLVENATRLNIDPEQVSLLGQSAGGHLALLEAYTNPAVHSVAAMYPPSDPAADYYSSRDKSAELDFIGGPPSQYSERYKRLTPQLHISENTPPTLLVQGTLDDLVNYHETVELSDELSRNGVSQELILIPFTGHSFENQRGSFSTQIATHAVTRFLKR